MNQLKLIPDGFHIRCIIATFIYDLAGQLNHLQGTIPKDHVLPTVRINCMLLTLKGKELIIQIRPVTRDRLSHGVLRTSQKVHLNIDGIEFHVNVNSCITFYLALL